MTKGICGIVAALMLVCGGCASTAPGDKPAAQLQAHVTMGVSYLREKNASQALQEFMAAEKLAPDNDEIQSFIAQAYEEKNALPLAEERYQKALSLKDSPYYRNNLANLYLKQERWMDAAEQFQKAAENYLFPYQANAYTGMGFAYQKMAKTELAMASYQKALQVNPQFDLARLHIAELLAAKGEHEKAVIQLKEVVKHNPNAPLPQYYLGVSLFELGKKAEAKEAFAKTVELAPNSQAASLAQNYLELLP